MTVSSSSSRNEYNGNGVTTSFAYTFRILDEDHVAVYQDGTLKTITTHYTVTGVGNSGGGSIVFGAAPAAGTGNVVIVRAVPLTQETDYVENDPFPAESHEDALDKLTMIVQQQQEVLDRAFTLDVTDTSTDATLPTPEASKLLGWSGSADALVNYASASISATIVPTAFMETLLDDASAADARTTLGAQEADDELTALAGLTSAANKVPMFSGSGTATLLDFKDEDNMASDSATAVPSQQSVKAYVTTQVSTKTGITLGTQQASTSGVAIDFTGIPTGTKRITVNFSSVSTNGTSVWQIQLGDAGGFETSGYVGGAGNRGGESTSASGFAALASVAAASTYSGSVVLNLENASAFTWCANGVLALDATGQTNSVAGVKSLSAELTQIRITTVNGTDAFDAGEVNVSYE